jgi:hypothetical protein
VLNYEIVQEQAAALGRLGRGLEAALGDLQEFDSAHPQSDVSPEVRQARRTLVTTAGHALRRHRSRLAASIARRPEKARVVSGLALRRGARISHRCTTRPVRLKYLTWRARAVPFGCAARPY